MFVRFKLDIIIVNIFVYKHATKHQLIIIQVITIPHIRMDIYIYIYTKKWDNNIQIISPNRGLLKEVATIHKRKY